MTSPSKRRAMSDSAQSRRTLSPIANSRLNERPGRCSGLLIVFVSRVYAFFQRTMPTNILIRATHTRRGLKWGVLAMLLAVGY
jgi:hypothetical protein